MSEIASTSIKDTTAISDGGSAGVYYERWLVLDGVRLFLGDKECAGVDMLRICLDRPAANRLLAALTALEAKLEHEQRIREIPPR